MANTTSIDILKRGIADQILLTFPDATIYDSPTQEGSRLPGFYLLLLPSSNDEGIGWNKRELHWEIAYLLEFNLPNTQTILTAAQELLDIDLQYFTVTDPTDQTTRVMRTYKRRARLELTQSVLHYTFTTMEWVALPSMFDDTPMPSTAKITLEVS